MSNKISLYSHILHFGILHLKNFIEMPIYKRVYCNKEKYISELIHLIPSLLHSEKYNEADVYFVEYELKRFVYNYPDRTDYTFTMIIDALLRIYDDIDMIFPLQWDFPDELRVSTRDKHIDKGL